MPSNRTVYRYHFKVGDEIAHSGITHNPEYSEMMHRKHVNRRGEFQQVGFRTTPENAKAWEAEERRANPDRYICPRGEYGVVVVR